MLLVSSCLAGIPCRYNGKSKTNPDIVELVERGQAIPVCPECLGGLPVPRMRAEIIGGDGGDVLDGLASVYTADLRNVTENFIKGAESALKTARENDVNCAILCSGSPSCGCGMIANGCFSDKKRSGDGVTTALLKRSGIIVKSI